MRYLPAALVLAACSPAATPPPEPVTPDIAVAPPPAPIAIRRRFRSAAPRLDLASLVPNANTVLVFDGERLDAYGLRDALALALAEGFDLDLAQLERRCGLDLSPGWLRQVVVSSAMFTGPVAVIATRRSPEPLLDCIAQQIPDATTEPLGPGAAIRVAATTFTIRDGKLLAGSPAALRALLRIQDPNQPDPSPDLLQELGGGIDVQDTLALLDGSPATVLTLGLQQPLGIGPRMSVSLNLRDPGDGTLVVELTAQLPEAQGELGELGELDRFPDQMIDKVLRELPVAAEELLGAGPGARAVSAIVETVELERDGGRVRLRAEVPDAAPLSRQVLAALAVKRAAERAELKKLNRNIAP